MYNDITLSTRETALLSAWERERKGYVTLVELRSLLGPSAQRAASALIRKGLLQHVAPGHYAIQPLRSLARPRSISAIPAAATLLADEPYYLGGLWAFSLHHLTQQVYGSLVDAYVTRRRRDRPLGAARLLFHVLPSTAFGYGIEPVTIESIDVRVSDAERTVLDALDYPRVVGGIRAALLLTCPALARVDAKRLISYAVRGSRTSTCQRLGVLLERKGVSERTLAPLAERVNETETLLSMIRDEPRVGRVNKAWRVVENDRPSGSEATDPEAGG
jgi:predicted transcriptional regulator of viral defense system